MRSSGILAVALFAAVGCSKKSVANPEDYEAIGRTFSIDAGASEGRPTRPTNGQPTGGGDLPGIETGKLSSAQRTKLAKLADALVSPCGKAESLRKALAGGACARAPFAARYVARLIGDDRDELEIRALYQLRYTDKPVSFELAGTPRHGGQRARVTLVEFFDYGCPHCAEFAPMLREIADDYPEDVVVYYKNFPLGSHPDSIPCAQAALAAERQGKFYEMHELLFRNQEHQSRADITKYAESIGLDMARFAKDFDDPAIARRIAADRKEGEQVGVQGTPTLFIGGRECMELSVVDIKDWIDEELAVNP